jgi:hypothetical protein
MSINFQLALGNNTPTTVSTAQGLISLSSAQFLDIGGGTAGQVLTSDGAGNTYFAGVSASGTDAPSDGSAYGRVNGTWAKVLPLTGGTLTGLLTLSGPPTNPLHAATKAYVDAAIVPVSVDGVSILGNGTSTPLRVGAIDAGTY